MFHLNREFNQYSLNDWWQWQKLQQNLNIPENWLKINNNLDVWFNMLLIANDYNKNTDLNNNQQYNQQDNQNEYVIQIANACLQHKKWSLVECFSSLSYWNQYKDILSNIDLFEKLIPIFGNKNIDFLKAIIITSLLSGFKSNNQLIVWNKSINELHKIKPIDQESIIWSSTWENLKYFTLKGYIDCSLEIIKTMSNYFELNDFLYLAQFRKQYKHRLDNGEIDNFKTITGYNLNLNAFIYFSILPHLTAFTHLTKWPSKINSNEYKTIENILIDFKSNKSWDKSFSKEEIIIKDWLFKSKLIDELEEIKKEKDEDSEKGRKKRKM